MATAMKLAKTSPAMPVLRRKKSRKKLVWGIAVGIGALVVVVAAAGMYLLSGQVSLSPDERQLVELINEKRRNNLIDELRPNAALCEVARRHSHYMCDQQRAELPTVALLEQELLAARYPFESWGILIERAENRTPLTVFAAWTEDEEKAGAVRTGELKSLHHAEVGICVMQDVNDPTVQWVTVVFGRKK